MNSDDIVKSLVEAFRADPRNKLQMGADVLLPFIASELRRSVSATELADALTAFDNGEASAEEQEIVDAGTALCHQVAARCWGECLDEANDEWSEVDISTDWSDYGEEPSAVVVTVRRG